MQYQRQQQRGHISCYTDPGQHTDSTPCESSFCATPERNPDANTHTDTDHTTNTAANKKTCEGTYTCTAAQTPHAKLLDNIFQILSPALDGMFYKLLNLIPYGMLIRGMILGFFISALSLYVKFS